jgi:hypothetical protein
MKSKLKPNVIYYWMESRDIVAGAMRVKVKTVDDIFWQGFKIANNPALVKAAKKKGKDISAINFYVMNKRKAISQVKTGLTNVYNAIYVHGKSILDINGNIDVERYKAKERKLMLRGGKKEFTDPQIDKPFVAMKDFKFKEITKEEAKELNIL